MITKIAAITMARNDEFFLSRWVEYYSREFGMDNLYIILDGTDQNAPKNAKGANVIKLPHTEMSRTAGDKYRISKVSDLAAELFKKWMGSKFFAPRIIGELEVHRFDEVPEFGRQGLFSVFSEDFVGVADIIPIVDYSEAQAGLCEFERGLFHRGLTRRVAVEAQSDLAAELSQ